MSGSSSSSAVATTVMASSPSPPSTTEYDVFLSFRGVDTRNNITTYLYDKLCKKNIKTFIDYNIDRGNRISDELYRGIEESMIYVIIFSENYASSAWCLKELVKILECKKKYDQRHVIPIFYKVEPSTVRYQQGSYEKAFADHIDQKWFDEEEIKSWKVVLTNAAEFKGTGVDDSSPETKVLDGIVEDILKKLTRSFSSTDDQGMVGIDERIAQIQSLLQLESASVRIVGIWGMGGIGKTTLARTLYKKLVTQFSSRSLVVNAQQEIERVGIDSLYKKYLSELLEEDIPSNGLDFAIERVKRAKVLLILDDFKNWSQLQELIGGRGNFGPGSRIIVTSRDMQMLKNAEADGIYQVKKMNTQDSWKLFRLKAFKQNCPVEVNADLVKQVLEYAKGVPLALKVLGSLLYGKTGNMWESVLQKLQKFPHVEIFNVLKLSYDGLDDEQKDIFLDIACFNAGYPLNHVVDILDGCGFYADCGIDVLKDKGLISILKDRIVVHDLIREMGTEVVRQECVNDPENRSRLWKHEEIYDVLRKNKGTDAIQCIFLDMCRIKKVQLHPQVFKSMPNLRVLYFHKYSSFEKGQSNVILPEFLESFPDGLKVLHWVGFPQISLPVDFCAENLVKLEMHDSHLKQLWDDNQEVPNLKQLDLSNSLKLTRIPDLSKFPKIEEILLSGCESLIQVYSSSFLSKLRCLWLNGCVELTSLNLLSNILSRSSGLVGLYNCRKLKTFSINGTDAVESRGGSHFDDANLKGTSGYQEMDGRGLYEKYSKHLKLFRETATPSRCSHELCCLDLDSCESLTSLPIDLCKLKLLRRLYVSGCSNLEKFPEIEETMENLVVLVLDETAIQELPSSFHRLVGLEELSLRKCQRLEIIPSWIGRLTKLSKLCLDNCLSLETFPSSIFNLKLTELDLYGCLKLKTFPVILEPAESFSYINLSHTTIKELPSSLSCLVGLEELSLYNCSRLEIIPSSIGRLTKLCKLDLSYCGSLETLPSSIYKLKLKKLDLVGCSKLKTFPEILDPAESYANIDLSWTVVKELPSSLGCSVGLQTLNPSECHDLELLPNNIGNLNLLFELDFSFCGQLTEIPNDIVRLSSLRKLSLQHTGIVNLPESIAHLSSLESLDVSYCRKLECIPQLQPFLKQILAFDCPSIKRVMPNSMFKLPSDSKEGTFELYFTNNEEQHPNALCDVVAIARLRIAEDAYRYLYLCFPGSAVPDWFPYRCEGNSLTVDNDSLNWCNDHGLIGFAMCVVLRLKDMDGIEYKFGNLRCRLTFESDGRKHILYNYDQINYPFNQSCSRMKHVKRDHTFLWKYYLMDSASNDKGIFHAHSFTFDVSYRWLNAQFSLNVKECGICPLYTKETDDNGVMVDSFSFLRVANNDSE